ncbi:MAG: cytochrome P450 [Rhodomicrobium sp.]|nr:MAG: cytochrome P450 [Rhodomicrobium sp.]
MPLFTPPTVSPPIKPLGIFASLKAVRQNALNIIPEIAYTQPIVTGETGIRRWHMVQGPEGLKQIFLDNVENYPKSEVVLRMLRPAVGDSLFTSEGKQWRWQRSAIAPVFTARNVNTLAPIMTETARRTTTRLKASSGPTELVREMLSATFDVICEVALSGRDHFDSKAYSAAITQYFMTIGRTSLLDFLETPAWIPRPAELFGANSVKTMHNMVAKAIAARQNQPQKNDSTIADDLLDYMLKAEDQETGRRMNQKDLLHNLQFFIVAGHETTAIALAWALYLCANDQTIQTQAREEARSVLGGRDAGIEDIKQAPLIEQILLESMRLYPPVGFLARKARGPDRLYDRDVKKGDTVLLNLYGLHRHQDLWDHPAAFYPAHFAPEAVKKRHRFQYVPFGGGPRICVGANFAMMQAQIILMTLLSKFRFWPTKAAAPAPVMQMTIRPEPGITLEIEDLSNPATKLAQ